MGSDGYKQTGTLITNAAGMVTFSVPGGSEDVVDTFNVTVGDINENYTYSF